ncbi:OmpA family protein [Phaeodactylibacter sp.]|jgi:peptidoglycan-associated lipoprotein|uniref:OmpA family protein n=1 Tax=Phaeodactylibacter sp. TaxID=1940289 RepID=UPI0025FE682E|nr:OmpA family protein [Phaeodactylibacter sp.]MCI4648050.1 OmpA family protein [Phaeodactylibacter sp.]MCI5091089.1 OmpA family protein [Phaeodactylibacter sp.]
MKNAYFILGLILLSGLQVLQAQPLTKSSLDQNLIAARKSWANLDYVNALEYYEDAYEDSDERALIDTIAILQFKVRDYRSAERWFSRLLRRDKEEEFTKYRYTYGQLLKMNEKYAEAIEEFQLFLATNPGDSLETLAKNEISGAELALELPQNLKGVTVENAGRDLNDKVSEYTPTLSSNGKEIYFATFDADDVIYVDEENMEETYAMIYRSTLDDTDWSKPQELGGEINRPGFHNSNVRLSPDGSTMYFTRAKLQGNTVSESKIYFSKGGGDSWSGAQELKGVNGDYIAKHPTPGELYGKRVLFFASNMEGGYGGFDLYYATLIGEGEYSAPVNMGDVINTPGDEETPYYREGTLYFASTGHPGLGGFDHFYSTWDGEKWSPVLNMGRGYNTSVDDYGFTLDEEGYFGVLTSNRAGGRSAYGRTCCDDIYTVNIARIVVDLVVGTFTNDKKPLTGSTVYLVPTTNDKMGTPNAQNSGDKSNVVGFDLALETPYMLIGTHPDYYPDTVTLNTVGVKESTSLEHRFYLEPKPVPPPEPEFDTLEINEPIVLENILYDFDSDRIREEAESDLRAVLEILNDYPEMVIELSSHTDSQGGDDYNEDLSQRRAESARRWLVREGIDRDRIVAKGYGESQPQTVNARAAALADFLNEGDVLTPEFIDALETQEQKERAYELNRRTEFKILEGPTFITIKRIQKKETTKEAPDRGSLPGGKPEMKFVKEFVDFGQVRKGEQKEYTFVFYNAGDAPFTIDLISACDCTKVVNDLTGETFEPGEKGRLEIIFDSSEKDESEVIDIDIFLAESDENGAPLMKTVQYKFELVK